jgi:hypothetical protein
MCRAVSVKTPYCFVLASALLTCTSGKFQLKIPNQRRGQLIRAHTGNEEAHLYRS